jgi:sulfur carrier protein
MITVFINGYATEVDPKHTLEEVVLQASQHALSQPKTTLDQPPQFDPRTVAVAINQHIVPRSQWSQVSCTANDHIELYNAVAGG